MCTKIHWQDEARRGKTRQERARRGKKRQERARSLEIHFINARDDSCVLNTEARRGKKGQEEARKGKKARNTLYQY